MKKWIKVLIAIFTVFIIILSTAFIIASISPYPTAWLVRGVFGLSSYSEHIDLVHEYQFNLGTISDDGKNYAQINFDELLLF